MRKKITAIILVLFCFLLQTTLFHALAFNGIIPNLLIILTASYGFMRGKKTGLITGFFCGFLLDIFFGSVIGFNALIYMWIGYMNGSFRKIFFPEDIKLPMFMIVLSDFIYGCLSYCVFFLLRGRFAVDYYLIHIILPEIVYTVFISMFLYPLILKLDTWLEKCEREE
ncbi:MAG: rod shape-determining protein MreD [Clostridiales bacterium]|nr:rod shape-determining protein MreD [Clostridiales bacterium]